MMTRYLKGLFWFFGVAHLLFGIAGTAFPKWFFETVPPWPPLHVGQIQIAGIFDLSLAVLFLVATSDPERYVPLVIPVGVVAECGHALVRIGHVIAGDNRPDDLLAPILMLLFGLVLFGAGVRRWSSSTSPRRLIAVGGRRAKGPDPGRTETEEES